MKTEVIAIYVKISTNRGAHAGVNRRCGNHLTWKDYNWISPATFGRIQRAQAAIMKSLFGRAR
jgi:hypothetical protein